MAKCHHCNQPFEQGSMVYQCPQCKGELCTGCYFENKCPNAGDG